MNHMAGLYFPQLNMSVDDCDIRGIACENTAADAELRRSASQESLPDSQGSRFDPIIFDFLRVPPEEYAKQITYMDFHVFKKIQPEELASIAWNTKEKLNKAPNIVAFTRRFNHVNFWSQQQILSTNLLKTRVDVLGHLIRIAKKCFDLNNLHGAQAILSALQSAAIWRLRRTWELLKGKEKSSFEKLSEQFSEENNRQNLRDHLEKTKLGPCIPFLGLYLADLYYIDVAHPCHGGLESGQRRNQMNNILRIISEFQQSDYSHLKNLEHLERYFDQHQYIEELQKFLEDDYYKLSLKLEPEVQHHAAGKSASLPRAIAVPKNQNTTRQINRARTMGLPSKPATMMPFDTQKSVLSTPDNSKFVPMHRKVKSLGQKITGSLVDNEEIPAVDNDIGNSADSLSSSSTQKSRDSRSRVKRILFPRIPWPRRSLPVSYKHNPRESVSTERPRRLTEFSSWDDDGFYPLDGTPPPSYSASLSSACNLDGLSEIGTSWCDKDDCCSSSSDYSSAASLPHPFNSSALTPSSRDGNRSPASAHQTRRTSHPIHQTGISHVLSPAFNRSLLDDSPLESSSSEMPEIKSHDLAVSTTGHSDLLIPDELNPRKPTRGGLYNLTVSGDGPAFRGCLKRKTLLKNFKRPAVSSWARFWVEIFGSTLLYYQPKALASSGGSGADWPRSCFRSEPSKLSNISGWVVVYNCQQTPSQADSFALTDPNNGHHYKFRAGSQSNALQWCTALKQAAAGNTSQQLPSDLINLTEDDTCTSSNSATTSATTHS